MAAVHYGGAHEVPGRLDELTPSGFQRGGGVVVRGSTAKERRSEERRAVRPPRTTSHGSPRSGWLLGSGGRREESLHGAARQERAETHSPGNRTGELSTNAPGASAAERFALRGGPTDC